MRDRLLTGLRVGVRTTFAAVVLGGWSGPALVTAGFLAFAVGGAADAGVSPLDGAVDPDAGAEVAVVDQVVGVLLWVTFAAVIGATGGLAVGVLAGLGLGIAVVVHPRLSLQAARAAFAAVAAAVCWSGVWTVWPDPAGPGVRTAVTATCCAAGAAALARAAARWSLQGAVPGPRGRRRRAPQRRAGALPHPDDRTSTRES